jgi:uncharacterized membrane protein
MRGTRHPCTITVMGLDLAVLVFKHVDGADHAYADAAEADPSAVWLREAAVVEHHRHDRISVRGSVAGHYVDADDQGDVVGKRALEGALTGAAAGVIFGPAGMAAGLAVGGTLGGVAEADSAPHVHSAFFDEVRAEVPPKSSAIVLLAAPSHVDDMVAALHDQRHTRLVRHQLSDDVTKSLQQAVSSSPEEPSG